MPRRPRTPRIRTPRIRTPRRRLLAGLLFAVLAALAAACAEGRPDGGDGGEAVGGEPNGDGASGAAAGAEEPAVPSPRAETETPLTLGRGRADLTVEAPRPATATATAGRGDDYLLVLDDLELLAPGAYYQVYLDLPPGAEPDPEGPFYVGNLSLFGLTREQLEEGEEPVRHSESFEIGDRVRELAGRGEWDGEIRLTFVRGNPAPATAAGEPEAFIRVGEVSVIQPE